jgi:hypothetical protein
MVVNRNITECNTPRGKLYFYTHTWWYPTTVTGYLWDGKSLTKHRTEEVISWFKNNTSIRTTGGIYELASPEETLRILERGLRQ